MHVDRARLDINVLAPHRVEQLLAREDTAGMLHEVAQQAKLGGAKMHRLAAADHTVGDQVHDDVGVGKRLVGQRGPDAAQHGADTRHQLGRRERLGDVVVGAGVEAAHAIALLTARRQHDDRQVGGGGLAAQLPANLDPRHQRQHPVEQDEIGRVVLHRGERLLAVIGDRDVEACLLEVVAQQLDQCGLVLDDQHARLQRRALAVAPREGRGNVHDAASVV